MEGMRSDPDIWRAIGRVEGGQAGINLRLRSMEQRMKRAVFRVTVREIIFDAVLLAIAAGAFLMVARAVWPAANADAGARMIEADCRLAERV